MAIRLFIFLISVFSSLFVTPQSAERKKVSILVYSATKKFRHQSIPDGIEAIKNIGTKNNWNVVATEDSSIFSGKKLKQFSAIVLLNTTGDIFNEEGQKALQDYIRTGGGLVGVHAASDAEYDWPWYNQMIGAYFESHPKIQKASIKVVETHPSTAHLENPWVRKDEWYNFKCFNSSVKVLLELDESSYEGGKMNGYHPIAWYHTFEGGKIFYTGLGHTSESYTEPAFLKHLEEGIKSVMK